MLKYTLKRLLHLIPVLFIISILLFGISKMMPGDPADLLLQGTSFRSGEEKQAAREKIRKKFGLDKSYPEQYIGWVKRIATGELGESTQYRKPVSEVIKEPLKNTLLLNLGATLISFILSIIIGIKSAVKAGGFFDKFFQIFSLIGISLPTFFIGIFLIYFFALKLRWFPIGGMPTNPGLVPWLQHTFLPTMTLMITSLASVSRYVRTAMLDALNQDYIRTARAKGLSEKKVIYSHAFRNALIPVVTIFAWAITGLLGGSAITETVFTFEGVGRYLISSVTSLDYNLLLALNMLYAVMSVLGNLLMDLGYSLVDPRVRLE